MNINKESCEKKLLMQLNNISNSLTDYFYKFKF